MANTVKHQLCGFYGQLETAKQHGIMNINIIITAVSTQWQGKQHDTIIIQTADQITVHDSIQQYGFQDNSNGISKTTAR